jgi:hypothetical protein
MDCETCFPKCYMSHPNAEFWDVEANDVTPLEVALNDNRKYRHICGECHHRFEASAGKMIQLLFVNEMLTK